jgi:hypothetical protein
MSIDRKLPTRPDMMAAASLSLTASLAQVLVRKGILARQDVLDLYAQLIAEKASSARQTGSDISAGAAALLAYAAEHFEKGTEDLLARSGAGSPGCDCCRDTASGEARH